ncbi:hypothetical protein [Cellulomonas composti]|uniref:Uncharacterized protein n=1 Tax=Cellulomonas composti TaxID=266130 RepID=A0A511JBW2_9CELL|nr:hypothetical protein [Cellulomonas composti]GEL95193.1 hypothetical protein CCO02nite_18510 [Cellulomonas composti]
MSSTTPVSAGSAVRAWVESPLQMVSALEAADAGLLGPEVSVVHRSGIRSIDELAARLGRVALPSGVRLEASSTGGLWRHPAPGAVGDAFSGAVQSRTLLSRRAPFVVLDDGLATLHLLDLLTNPSASGLSRARAKPGTARRSLALAARSHLLGLARRGRLTVFTVLPVRPEVEQSFAQLGGQIVAHSFAWSSSLREPELHGAREVVVGSAMATDGLVHRAAYTSWVHGIAEAASGEVVYIPHRRESPSITAHVADRASVRVERGPWPVEVSLRCLPQGAVVHCLPSTPLLSLRGVLADAGVTLSGTRIPDSWWTTAASARFRASLPDVEGLEP